VSVVVPVSVEVAIEETVTLNVVVAMASVVDAVQITVVVPIEKSEPLEGAHETNEASTVDVPVDVASIAIGRSKLTIVPVVSVVVEISANALKEMVDDAVESVVVPVSPLVSEAGLITTMRVVLAVRPPLSVTV